MSLQNRCFSGCSYAMLKQFPYESAIRMPLLLGLCVLSTLLLKIKPGLANQVPTEAQMEARSAKVALPEVDATTPQHGPATTVTEWMAQIEASLVQVTGVQVEATETGLSVLLETAEGTLPTPTTTVTGNALTATIPNAVLSLPEGETFEALNPAVGIDRVSVVGLPGDQVQVEIVGTEVPPTAEVTASASGLTFAVIPGVVDTAQEDAEVEITVTAEQVGSEYVVPDASSTLRTDIPIFDTPASVQVVPQKVIKDQGATSVRDITRNVSGVNFAESSGNRNEQFIIRGFVAENGIFRNGFREDTFSTRTQTELANIDRVEVLKGPASILFGRSDPAGIVNFVTKKPSREPFYEIGFTAGSFDFYRPTLDSSGPLTQDGNLAYRLNASYENAGSFRNGVNSERFFVAPTLSWQLTDDTDLTLEFSYLNDTQPVDRGLVVLSNNKVADIPFSTFLGDPDISANFEETRTELALNHRFSDNLSLRTLLRYSTATETHAGVTSQIDFGAESEDDQNFPTIENNDNRSFFETFTIQSDLTAKFNTGSLEHTVLFGVEYFTGFQSFLIEQRSTGIIDIFNASAFEPTDEPFDLIAEGEFTTESFGIFLQDQIAILDNLKLVIGGRFDTVDTAEEDFIGDEVFEANGDAFTPRFGIIYQPIEPVSLYASFSQSFFPSFGTSVDGEPFEPTRGTIFEIGVKTEIIKDKLFSTLALYDTTQTNVATADPDNAGFEIQTGKQNSQGIELDLQGEILPGWNIFAGYAYADAKVTEDNDIPIGNRLTNVPEHKFNLWTTYTLQEGALSGLGFGAGVFYVGERAGDLDNSFFVDDYVRVDAAIYYERDNYRFALNFKNLFDADFIEGTGGRVELQPGAPFTVLGTVSWRF